MSNAAAEIGSLADEIAALGEQIERKRKQILALLGGATAIDRRGERYTIDNVKIYPGGNGYRVFLDGPLLKRDGQPHARTRCSNPVSLLDKIEP